MRIFMVTLALLVCSLVKGQETTRGPHNGVVAAAGEYRIETLGCDEYLEIYVFDKYMDPILNYGTGGDVKFFKGDNANTSVPIVLYGSDGFTAKFPEYVFSTYKVTVNIKGVTYSAKFNNTCAMPN